MNETNYAQQQIDQSVCDQLTKGIFWNASSSGMQNIGNTIVINENGRSYQIQINLASTGVVNSYTSSCNYDTLQ
jgi:hypothetical protein